MSSDIEAIAEAESRKEWSATSEAIRNDALAVPADNNAEIDGTDDEDFEDSDEISKFN